MLKRKSRLILLLVTLSSCGQSESVKTDIAAVNNDKEITEEHASEAYESMCSLCHGMDGKRKYLGAPDLSTSIMSFKERIEIISSGKGAMVPFAEKLNKQEITAIAHYLETLTK